MVLQRELRANSRRWLTYWSRFIAGGIGVWVLAMHLNAYYWFRGGRGLFSLAVTIAFMACLIEGVRRAGSCVADEKEEGTYGLLLLTRLSGQELLFGKFSVALLASLQLALALLPILAIPVLMGGVSFSELCMAYIALLHTLSLATAIGVVMSSIVSTSIGAMFATALVVVVCGGFSMVVFVQPIVDTNPVFYFHPLTPVVAWDQPGLLAFWTSMILWQAFVFCLLWHRGRRLASDWLREQDERVLSNPVVVPATTGARPNTDNRYFAPAWFEEHPMVWLSLREMGMHGGTRTLSGIAGIIAVYVILAGGAGLVIGGLVAAMMALWLSVACSRPVALLKRSGVLEVLLTTPLSEQQIIKGHIAAARKVFFWPGAIICLGAGILIFRESYNERDLIAGYYILAGFFLLLWSGPWFATAVALHAKTPARAAIWSVILIVVLPRLAFCVFGDAPYFLCAMPVSITLISEGFDKLRGGRSKIG